MALLPHSLVKCDRSSECWALLQIGRLVKSGHHCHQAHARCCAGDATTAGRKSAVLLAPWSCSYWQDSRECTRWMNGVVWSNFVNKQYRNEEVIKMNRDGVIRYISMQHAPCPFNFGRRAWHVYKAHGSVEPYIIYLYLVLIYMDIPCTKKPTTTESQYSMVYWYHWWANNIIISVSYIL